MEWRTQQARRFYRWRGESSPACVVCECNMRAVNQHVKDLGQGPFRSKVIAQRHTHTHTQTHTVEQLHYVDHTSCRQQFQPQVSVT